MHEEWHKQHISHDALWGHASIGEGSGTTESPLIVIHYDDELSALFREMLCSGVKEERQDPRGNQAICTAGFQAASQSASVNE